jgi:hypothetical protein
MNIKMISTIAIALTLSACGEKANYDPEYVFEQAKACNLKPYIKMYDLCKVESEDGVEPKRACKTKNQVLAVSTARVDISYLTGDRAKYKCLVDVMKYKK